MPDPAINTPHVPRALRPATILHVDDDEANRYAVTRSLIRAGFKVIEAASGNEALATLASASREESASEKDIGLIILDVRLPDVDGFEVCRRVKDNPETRSIPVLHLSANLITSQDKATGLDGGADAYLIRPVAPVELIATVNALLRTRQAEEELRAARDEAVAARAAAETANRVKDEFLATLSHELRTPLTAIVGWANILQRGRASPAEHMEGLKTIERNAKAQAKLIEDLLDVSRIISGKLRLEMQRLDFCAALDAAIKVISPTTDVKRIRIARNDDCSEFAVNADPGRLQQVLGNLLGNAVKFTPEGGEIRVSVRHSDGIIETEIADDGRGIAPEFLPHIFERFRQADISSRREKGGLGLGLAIVRQLVELHGGSISAHSDGVDRGATFTVRLPDANATTLPAASERPSTEKAPLLAADDNAFARLLEGVSILVIEDDADCRSLAGRVLQACGATAVEVASVAEAFEAMQGRKFDAIVSDIGMPVEDGYDFIRRLRQLSPEAGGKIPALALSAFVQADSQRKMITSGFDLHLGKPVDPRSLCESVAKIIEAARQQLA